MGTPETETVRVAEGALRGSSDGLVRRFFGIPYAEAPVGENRWRSPEPPARWTAVRDATRFGPASRQPPARFLPSWEPPEQSEDCLNLNIWTPIDADRLPVVVLIHGGGFQIGSGRLDVYDGSALSRRGLVVVTINYRLGILGFVGGANWLLDQIAALRWVQANIAEFGGDPARVTVAGMSAGAVSVNVLVTAPRARGLIDQAIVMSGGGDLMFTLEPPSLTPADFPSDGPVPVLADAMAGGVAERPLVDGSLIALVPSIAFANAEMNVRRMVIGFSSYESSILDQLAVPVEIMRPLLMQLVPLGHEDEAAAVDTHTLYENIVFRQPAIDLAKSAAGRGVETFLFDYGHVPGELRTAQRGSPHTLSMYTMLGNVDAGFAELGAVPSAEDLAAARAWQDSVVAFIRGDRPKGPAAAEWPLVSVSSDLALVVSVNGTMRLDAATASIGVRT